MLLFPGHVSAFPAQDPVLMVESGQEQGQELSTRTVDDTRSCLPPTPGVHGKVR